ncbi:MAG: PTS transporter subunit EIIC, partial [Oscillibacter sp.]|nr:PTS transporter subunit EIIC [Oscillibacter sp.]
FGFPITAVSYNSTVFPVILGVLFMSILYWILQKITPVFMRTIFVPLITVLVTVPVTLLYLGPAGGWAGDALAKAVYDVYQQYPPVAVMLIGCLTPWMVFFGMNNATYPIVFALMAEVGSDPLICTGMAPANVAVGGACLAVALKSRDVNLKGVGLSAGVTALCGITEPGVYGVLFPKRTPLVGAMLGGGLGGLLAGYLGMTQYVISTPGFISFPAYINPDGSNENFLYAMGVMALAVILSFVFTWLLYREKQPETPVS